MNSTPAYNIPDEFTGMVTGSYGNTGILLAYRNGEVLRGKSGGLRKFKTAEAVKKALDETE